MYVSDIIHKRGHKLTDDILLMEEQQLESYGDPLSTNSKLGQMRALKTLPALNTANGEGDLIAYYDYGVVSYNTFQFPRETRSDAEGYIFSDPSQVQKSSMTRASTLSVKMFNRFLTVIHQTNSVGLQ